MQSMNPMLMKFCPVVAACLMVFTYAPSQAKTKKECELIQQRIDGVVNVNSVCAALYQECRLQSAKEVDPKQAHNQCLKDSGDCQMAGQLSGEDLNRVIRQFESACQR